MALPEVGENEFSRKVGLRMKCMKELSCIIYEVR